MFVASRYETKYIRSFKLRTTRVRILKTLFFLLLLVGCEKAEVERSIFALVKLSYNYPGETPLEGGICGTAFLINDSTLLTAYHVINENVFKPNPGFKYVQYWVISRSGKVIIPVFKEYLKSFPGVEATTISIPQRVKNTLVINYRENNCSIKDKVQNFGHKINMPVTDAHWENNVIVIDDYDLKTSKSDSTSFIINIKRINVFANDVNIRNKMVIQPSFRANIGMSRGPLLKKGTNEVIGMMSFGLPPDSIVKDTVYAIHLYEIFKKIRPTSA